MHGGDDIKDAIEGTRRACKKMLQRKVKEEI